MEAAVAGPHALRELGSEMEVDVSLPESANAGRGRRPPPQVAAVTAALQLLDEVGLEQLTMDSVARRAGMSKATLYRRWPGKIHLAIEAISTELGPPLQSSGATATDIRALVEWTVNAVAQRVGEVFLSDATRDPAVASQLQSLIGPHRAAHAALLAGAAGRGDLPHDLDLTTTLDLLAGIALFRRLTKRSLDNTLVDQLTLLLQYGELPRTIAGVVGRYT